MVKNALHAKVEMAFCPSRFNPNSSVAGIAQLVEQLICNSSLTSCVDFRSFAQRAFQKRA
jgi:hypothetical protein